jgi:hypothetical protein
MGSTKDTSISKRGRKVNGSASREEDRCRSRTAKAEARTDGAFPQDQERPPKEGKKGGHGFRIVKLGPSTDATEKCGQNKDTA